MFLTEDQVGQLQVLCEKVASNRTRTGYITLEIRNNMPRTYRVEEPVFDDDHVEIGSVTHIVRCVLPEEEIRKGRQRNRKEGKRG